MKEIKILHVVQDEKFFDGTLASFETESLFDNKCVFFSKNKSYHFKHIKETSKVILLWNDSMIKSYLWQGSYDILYFHSISPLTYKYFKFIPDDKIVIWWGWGYDIYNNLYGMPPLIPVNLYKPKTKKYISADIRHIIKKCVFFFLKKHYLNLRKDVLKRIDYYQPVIPVELKLLRRLEGFSANEFYSPNNFRYNINIDKSLLTARRSVDGNILLGNSANITNNHLDVWEAIKDYIPAKREIVMPLSYGDMKYAQMLHNNIHSSKHEFLFLDSYLSSADYISILNDCSYAVFGTIRQQAMGNIYYCLRHNIKVFLYKDSVVYRYLTESGYCVFDIETIDANSFVVPLSAEESKQNDVAFSNEYEYRQRITDKCISEFLSK